MNKQTLKSGFITAIILLMGSLKGFSQSDFGSSLSLDLSKKLFKNLTLEFEEEVRFRDNSSELERFSTAIDLSYKICRYLKVGGAYNLINYDHQTKGWEIRHRCYFYATGSYKIDRVKFSLRERYQSTYREGVAETAKRANPKKYLRSRLAAEWDIRKSKFTPFASFEMFHTLNNPLGDGLDQVRYIAGTDYNFNKKNAIKLAYRYNDSQDPDDDGIGHMICIGYSHKF